MKSAKDWKPEVVWCEIDKIIPYARNAKKHSSNQVQKIAASIAANGFTQPIVVDSDHVVIAGHGRLEAARQLLLKCVPIIVADHLDEYQAAAYRIADNKVSESEWDEDFLKFEIGSLDIRGFDLSSTGFEMDELKKLLPDDSDLLKQLNEKQEHEESRAENLASDVRDTIEGVKKGDVWILGNHRLMCGDSTNEADVSKLMNGQKAALWASDPPYGISYVDNVANKKGQAKGYKPIANDELQDKALYEFILKCIKVSLPHMKKGFAFYMWHAMKMQAYFSQAAAAAAAGILFHRQIIWVKPQFVFGRGHYHWRHELCLMGWLTGDEPPFYGERNQTSVWEIGRENDKIHPTQKPVAIWGPSILKHTKEDEICYEPFSCSGSQLIACERLKRTCYGMEFEPHYCGIILRRWAEYTGNDPVREHDGALWSDTMKVVKSDIDDSQDQQD